MNYGPNNSGHPVSIAPLGAEATTLDGPVIDLRGLVSTMWRGKWIIAICVLVAVALAYSMVSRFQPQFYASGKVMFEVQQTNVVPLTELLTNGDFDRDVLQNEIEVLRSRSLAERVIDALQLDKDPNFNPALAPPRTSLRDYVISLVPFDLSRLGVSTERPAIPPEELARIERLQLVDQLRANLRLSPVGRTRVIEIAYVSPDPHLSAAIVNMVAEQYIFDQLESKLEAARTATAWLSERVETLRVRLTDSENAVEDARVRLSESSGQSVDITRQRIQGVTGQLTTARRRTASLQAQYDRIAEARDSGVDIGSVPEFRDSEILQNYREEEIQLLAQQQSLSGSLREGHPALVRIAQQLSELETNRDAETARIVDSIRIELEAAGTEEDALAAELAELEALSLRQSRGLLELRQLEREAEANRLLYENLLNRQREVALQKDLESANVRVLSNATAPLRPAGQREKAIMLIAAVLGGIGGAAIVLFLDFLNNTFRAASQVESQTGLPVLGMIPAVGARMRGGEVAARFLKRQNSSLAEAVRNLRTSILFSNLDKPPKVVMITSSTPKEGKSTMSLLMSLTSAQMGKRTVLIDCDLRRPAIASMMGLEKEEKPGFFSVIQGQAALEDAIHTDHATGLDMLVTNSFDRPEMMNAADVLASRRFQELIRALSARYDMVVVDTPPALIVTDARVVSSIVDAVIYAVRWGRTPRGAVLEGIKELRGVDAPLIGTVMTMINETKAAKYIYEGQQWYRGRHREYYID